MTLGIGSNGGIIASAYFSCGGRLPSERSRSGLCLTGGHILDAVEQVNVGSERKIGDYLHAVRSRRVHGDIEYLRRRLRHVGLQRQSRTARCGAELDVGVASTRHIRGRSAGIRLGFRDKDAGRKRILNHATETNVRSKTGALRGVNSPLALTLVHCDSAGLTLRAFNGHCVVVMGLDDGDSVGRVWSVVKSPPFDCCFYIHGAPPQPPPTLGQANVVPTNSEKNHSDQHLICL